MPEAQVTPVSLHWCIKCGRFVRWGELIHELEVHAPKITRYPSGNSSDWVRGEVLVS